MDSREARQLGWRVFCGVEYCDTVKNVAFRCIKQVVLVDDQAFVHATMPQVPDCSRQCGDAVAWSSTRSAEAISYLLGSVEPNLVAEMPLTDGMTQLIDEL